MIERKFVAEKIKEQQVEEYVASQMTRVGHSSTTLKRTPLGDKVIISVFKPGLVVGRKGANIKSLSKALEKKFKLENPQIEINEVKNENLDATIVSEKITSALERFGSGRFKGIMHKAIEDTMSAGALGIEVLISGKIPSSRAKTWRVVSGYLKKCGDISVEGVLVAYAQAFLKTGVVGVQVRIMPSGLRLPDDCQYIPDRQIVVEEVVSEDDSKVARTVKKQKQQKAAEKTDAKESQETVAEDASESEDEEE